MRISDWSSDVCSSDLFSGYDGPWHEITDAVGGITVGEAGEGFGQPLVGVDGAELATFDERGDHRPVVAALVGTGKQGIFAIASQRPDRSFDGKIGRASCRERVCKYGSIAGVAVELKKKKNE